MYTTLAKLKANEACVPGFGRMLEFFGADRAIKDQKIPLYVVGLVGGSDDFHWALTNACVIDKAEYLAFRARTITAVWNYTLRHSCVFRTYKNIKRREQRLSLKEQVVFDFVERMMALTKPKDIEAAIADFGLDVVSHSDVSNFMGAAEWANPKHYINRATNIIGNCAFNFKTLRDTRTKFYKELKALEALKGSEAIAELLMPGHGFKFMTELQHRASRNYTIVRDATGAATITIKAQDERHVFALIRMMGRNTNVIPDEDSDEDRHEEQTEHALWGEGTPPAQPRAVRAQRSVSYSFVDDDDEEADRDEDELLEEEPDATEQQIADEAEDADEPNPAIIGSTHIVQVASIGADSSMQVGITTGEVATGAWTAESVAATFGVDPALVPAHVVPFAGSPAEAAMLSRRVINGSDVEQSVAGAA